MDEAVVPLTSSEASLEERQDNFFPSVEGEQEEGETRGRFGFLRGGFSLLWILLAVLFSVMRACGGGEG